ncbi:MAG: hypothetical protein WCP97_03390 [bacterium]
MPSTPVLPVDGGHVTNIADFIIPLAFPASLSFFLLLLPFIAVSKKRWKLIVFLFLYWTLVGTLFMLCNSVYGDGILALVLLILYVPVLVFIFLYSINPLLFGIFFALYYMLLFINWRKKKQWQQKQMQHGTGNQSS